MIQRIHMNFDEAIALLQVGATSFTFKNQAGEIFKADKDKDLFITITHVPKQENVQ